MSIFETEPPALQLIAKPAPSGWSLIENIIRSTGTADLHIVPRVETKPARKKKTPPPAIKVVSAIDLTQYGAYRERQRLNRRLCHGHIEAAELYQEILDPFLRKHKAGDPMVKNTRDGVYWWGRSWEKYADKMHWTERQVKYRLKQLREFGLIATRMAKTPFNMLQVRPLVAEGAAYLTGTPDASNYPGLKSESEPQSLTGQGTQPINCPQAVGQDLSSGSKTKIVPTKALGLEVGLKEVGLKERAGKTGAEHTSPMFQGTATGEAGVIESETLAVALTTPNTPKPDALPVEDIPLTAEPSFIDVEAKLTAQLLENSKKAVQLAIEQHEQQEALMAEALANGDPLALPPYQHSEPPPKAPPVIAAAPVEVVPEIDYEAMGLKPYKTPEQQEAEYAAFAKAFKAKADAQRYAEEQARLKKKAEAEAAHAAVTKTKLKKHIFKSAA